MGGYARIGIPFNRESLKVNTCERKNLDIAPESTAETVLVR